MMEFAGSLGASTGVESVTMPITFFRKALFRGKNLDRVPVALAHLLAVQTDHGRHFFADSWALGS